MICVNHEEKTITRGVNAYILSLTIKSKDFAQSQENFALSHNRETVKFRNSAGAGAESGAGPEYLIHKIGDLHVLRLLQN